jgi:alkylated DNA repair protein alkB family protein 8
MRKRTKGLQVIVAKEKRAETELVASAPRQSLLVVHGTHASEAEFNVLRDKLLEFGQLSSLVLVPGVPYGYASFTNLEAAAAAEAALNHPDAEVSFSTKPQTLNLFYTDLPLDSLSLHSSVKCTTDGRVPGLILDHDFISPEQEAEIVAALDLQEWTKLTNRRVQHYGYEFRYGANSFDEPHRPMPEWAGDILERLRQRFDVEFDQLTVNDYAPGDSIPPHTDSHSPFEETLACVSLLSPIAINYRLDTDLLEGPSKTEAGVQRAGAEVNLYIPPRSLLVMQGEARYVWKHSIQQRRFEVLDAFTVYRRRRLSLTFRKTRSEPCQCAFPAHCDAQGAVSEAIMPADLEGDEDIEQKWVHDVYDKIAEHFSHTRYKPWPRVKAFLDSLAPEALVLDVGCGNGKYLAGGGLLRMGTDRSSKLLEICEERGFSVFTADCCALPLRTGVFDAAICIAVIHHLSTPPLRALALTELCRVLAPGGQALIYVWAKEQTEKSFPTQDCLVPWHLQDTYTGAAATGEGSLLPEKRAVLMQRYYHVFIQGELESLVQQVSWKDHRLEVTESYYDHANWVVRLTKV